MNDIQQINQRLEAEWDLSTGFLGRLREGHYDPTGFLRYEQLLRSIRLDEEKPLDRRFVALTWYVPMFMSWQRKRIQEVTGSTKELAIAITRVENLITELLGAP